MAMRIQDAFLDAPTLTLTPAETAPRFGLDVVTAQAFLAALADAGVLIKTEDGAYARRIAPRGFASVGTSAGGAFAPRRRERAA
jgi:hypothetical protein